MASLLLVHWNEPEAEERARKLRRAGHEVRCHWSTEQAMELRALRAAPPEAVVVDLARLPSHGTAVATFLRQQKATRHVPLVLVEGDPAKMPKVRALLPDATFTTWPRIRGAVKAALAARPEAVVVPGTMAGYSGTPLAKKLGIQAGARVALRNAPEGFESLLAPLPEGVRLERRGRGEADVVILFAPTQAALSKGFAAAARAVAAGGRFWLAWPKKTGPLASDVSEPTVRALGLAEGWVDYKICAIDGTWSGLCFSRRGTASRRQR